MPKACYGASKSNRLRPPHPGERYAMPPRFVVDLALLRPRVKPKGGRFETKVNFLDDKLYVLTTQLVVEFDAGSLGLPDWWFAAELIQILEAFNPPPIEVFDHHGDLCFRWADGQEYLAHHLHPVWASVTNQLMADQAFNHFRHLTKGSQLTTRQGARSGD